MGLFFNNDGDLFDIFSKKMLFGMLMASGLIGLISCSSCSKTNTVVPPKPAPTVSVVAPVVPSPTVQNINDSKYNLTVPLSFEKHSSDDPDYLLFADVNNKQLLTVFHQAYASSYEEYVLEAIRYLKEKDAVVHSATKTLLKNQEFTVVESSKDGVIAWLWLTTKAGTGYSLTCGGIETSTTVHDVCFDIADSFEVK